MAIRIQVWLHISVYFGIFFSKLFIFSNIFMVHGVILGVARSVKMVIVFWWQFKVPDISLSIVREPIFLCLLLGSFVVTTMWLRWLLIGTLVVEILLTHPWKKSAATLPSQNCDQIQLYRKVREQPFDIQGWVMSWVFNWLRLLTINICTRPYYWAYTDVNFFYNSWSSLT